MKKYFLLFVVGLLACAGSRESDKSYIQLGTATHLSSERDISSYAEINLPPDSSLTWVDESIGEIYGFRAPTQALKSSNSDSVFLCLGCYNLGLSHERDISDNASMTLDSTSSKGNSILQFGDGRNNMTWDDSEESDTPYFGLPPYESHERGEFIVAAPVSDTSKNRSDDKKPKPFFHKIDTSAADSTLPSFQSSGFLRYGRAIRDEHEAQQQFDIRVTITFPRMTLQQAAELEARVRKLFPEAQEIDFGLEKKIEAPGESFYYDMPDGVEFRILPGTLPRVYNTLPFNPGQDLRIEIDSTENVIYFSAPSAPREGLKPGSILQADSTGMPAWRVF